MTAVWEQQKLDNKFCTNYTGRFALGMVIKAEIFTHHMLVGVVFPLMVLRMTVVSLCIDGQLVSVSYCRRLQICYAHMCSLISISGRSAAGYPDLRMQQRQRFTYAAL